MLPSVWEGCAMALLHLGVGSSSPRPVCRETFPMGVGRSTAGNDYKCETHSIFEIKQKTLRKLTAFDEPFRGPCLTLLISSSNPSPGNNSLFPFELFSRGLCESLRQGQRQPMVLASTQSIRLSSLHPSQRGQEPSKMLKG